MKLKKIQLHCRIKIVYIVSVNLKLWCFNCFFCRELWSWLSNELEVKFYRFRVERDRLQRVRFWVIWSWCWCFFFRCLHKCNKRCSWRKNFNNYWIVASKHDFIDVELSEIVCKKLNFEVFELCWRFWVCDERALNWVEDFEAKFSSMSSKDAIWWLSKMSS